jgi:glycosyltransferase involved in cell wall biosynthesis
MSSRTSVIIPVRNGELYLAEAIESVIKQTTPPSEIIVVNNGSTDGSRSVAERFPRHVRVIDEPVAGCARARNAGVQAAAGDFIAFLDADDLWTPHKLARQVEILEQAPEISLVFTYLEEFISPELTAQQRETLSIRGPTEGWQASTMLCRAQVFRSVGPMPQLHVGEFIAWYGLTQTAGFQSRMLAESYVRRRVHMRNMTRGNQDMNGYLKAAKMVLDSRRAKARLEGA